ncbi:MAG: hypothetical protein ABI811_09345 [Acidobacteriota bacterium]
MDLVKIGSLFVILGASALAADLSIQIGNPAGVKNADVLIRKNPANFGVRVQGCTQPSEARFSGTAERKSQPSVPLTFVPGTTAGEYLVTIVPALHGKWVAMIQVECAGSKAGAIVITDAERGYVRDGSKFLTHAPSKTEVEAVLNSIEGGSR